ncbi:TPA_asm: DNA repair exonuclease [Listeria monocytogenes]|uniref:DNA repair exonuclease n=3 Tax=Listeria monocytogenes TaxID=1639 RepID=A0A5M0ZYH4_LISMN|nr:exonuclease SbcCD subunit D [Listeria monocytogenes]EAE3706586.1 exonuclease SbcCD subunit D [Listeria monocytogenes serotype 1/2b]EAF3077669.1 exonuclease SbcCD subunit D [Listeria monocytogenes serotype 1/2a]EAG6253058.1 exonuclease SbcCD subunit D [Listeria monocytogenes CFSAN003806]EAG6262431.1 exonuclease SbcCD subunit D [Listeria monocytogenes CFSAN003725]EEP3935553.1 exonuclease SbcCD subunit D [Listeria monocytogenes serotype 7]MCZ93594.1 exonuclease SbcCD subunit D [Listeria monoc
MKEIQFLHMADLHLDSPFIGLSTLPQPLFSAIQESTFQSLERITTVAIKEAVDFVLIAGDIYDSEDQSVRAQARFSKEMKRLEVANIPVFMIHGNHDFIEKHKEKLTLPSNVHVFSEQVEVMSHKTATGVSVNIYGFSYNERHIRSSRVDKYKIQGNADFHIALLHGSEVSSSEEHDVYAPFRVQEISKKGFDYWALGHIHKRQLLAESPSIYYPGNIQGRNRKESGEKGASIITLSEASTTIDFIGTSPIIWEEAVITLPENSEINAFYRETTKLLESYQGRSHSYFLHIIVKMENKQKIDTNDWLQMLQEEVEITDNTFVWIHKLTTEITNQSNSQTWYESHLAGEEIKHSFETLQDESAFYQAVEALYLESGVSRYLDDLSEIDRERLLHDALMELGRTLAEVEGDDK